MKSFTQFTESFASGVSGNWAKDLAAKNKIRIKAEKEKKAAEMKAAKSAQKKAERASEKAADSDQFEKIITRFANMELYDALGQSYPDTDPYDYLARKYPQLARMAGKRGSKLNELMNTAAKKMGYKDFSDLSDNFAAEQGM